MGQTCTVSLLGVGERYFREGRKSEKLFVRVFLEKYVQVVWDILGVVHELEVSTRDEESVGHTETNGESDLTLGSKSPIRSPYVW